MNLDGVERNFQALEGDRYYLTRQGGLVGPLLDDDSSFRAHGPWSWLPSGGVLIPRSVYAMTHEDDDHPDDLVWLVPKFEGMTPVGFREPAVDDDGYVISGPTNSPTDPLMPTWSKPCKLVLQHMNLSHTFGKNRVILRYKNDQYKHRHGGLASLRPIFESPWPTAIDRWELI